MADEKWLPVTGWEGGYEISDLGRVRSLNGNWSGKILRNRPDKAGYARVQLKRAPGKWRPISIHTLVTAAFIGPRPENMEVRHLDGNKMNGVLSNLTFGTRSENQLDSVRHGTHNSARKTHCPQEHEYTTENTYIDGLRRRHCRTCRRITDRASKRKQRKSVR